MGIKEEIAIVVNAVEGIISVVEKIDPAAANNVVVIELSKVLSLLKALGV